MMSSLDVDQYFGGENIQVGYDILKKRYESGDKSSELLWRMARFCHELSCRCTDKTKKKELVFAGRAYALEGHQLDRSNFNALKWAAILTGASTGYLNTNEMITEGGRVKVLLDKALAIDAKDFHLLHLRGRFTYYVTGFSSNEQERATVVYTVAPSGSPRMALRDFEAAYKEKPEWIENLMHIARIYFHDMSDKANAKKYLNILLAIKPNDEVEQEYYQEAQKLLSKC